MTGKCEAIKNVRKLCNKPFDLWIRLLLQFYPRFMALYKATFDFTFNSWYHKRYGRNISLYSSVDLGISQHHGISRHLLLQGLVKCIGGVVLAGILCRIAQHHRYVTGGFPDLTVWNPDSRKFKAGTLTSC